MVLREPPQREGAPPGAITHFTCRTPPSTRRVHRSVSRCARLFPTHAAAKPNSNAGRAKRRKPSSPATSSPSPPSAVHADECSFCFSPLSPRPLSQRDPPPGFVGGLNETATGHTGPALGTGHDNLAQAFREAHSLNVAELVGEGGQRSRGITWRHRVAVRIDRAATAVADPHRAYRQRGMVRTGRIQRETGVPVVWLAVALNWGRHASLRTRLCRFRHIVTM